MKGWKINNTLLYLNQPKIDSKTQTSTMDRQCRYPLNSSQTAQKLVICELFLGYLHSACGGLRINLFYSKAL